MQPEIEKIIGTLELLTHPHLRFDLPGHEDGGNFFPFAWDVSEWGKFNIRNLCLSNGWLKITDADATFKDWQHLEYIKGFPDFNLNSEEQKFRENSIKKLFQFLENNLEYLESFILDYHSDYAYAKFPGFIIGRTKSGDWIGIGQTFYKETAIPKNTISCSPQISINSENLEESTLNLIAKIQEIISELGTIHFSGDLGGGYLYTYEHKIVFTTAKTKELVFEKIIQASEILEVNQFYNFYPNADYLQDWYRDDNYQELSQRYDTINRFFSILLRKYLCIDLVFGLKNLFMSWVKLREKI
ncbi:hypothetical protein [Okeania sp. KiyG1]|uniref:hypothetical protein n=1 Tax=Okeania sp. KiyG1 TaxID=2720165 RepID=UPI0019228F34|nr:hypothetical protein [Okeania sp. KiyG1]GGA06805.1 hypothetical protein CYANOKiyG1_19210 [Okeania sp. KiyG1]